MLVVLEIILIAIFILILNKSNEIIYEIKGLNKNKENE